MPAGRLLDQFLRSACPDHHIRGRSAHVGAVHTAMRLLEQHPGLAAAGFATRVVTGDITGVERALRESPDLATARGGPKDWEPLLYLAFTRLPLAPVTENAVAIARLLLDAGADPTVFFMAGGSRYTPLVGAIGEGEENRPPHQCRDGLVSLLLARGANLYDDQVIYDIAFGTDALWYLCVAHARAVKLGRGADWDDPEWRMLDMGGYGSGARWHLELAIDRGDIALAEWCLDHGANPDAPPGRSGRLKGRPLYDAAVRAGQAEIAELLLRHGARSTDVLLDGVELLADAALRLDAEAVRTALEAHPEYLADPRPLFRAAARNRPDAAALLLDLGYSPDVRDEENERALHVASSHNAVAVAQLLIARGAEIDAVETRYHGSPLGRAVYYRHQPMIDLLAGYSRDVWELAFVGKVDRLRELLSERPELGRIGGGGQTPLMWLPAEDEGLAIEIARLFLAHGADPGVRNPEGQTAADRAAAQGMTALAALLAPPM